MTFNGFISYSHAADNRLAPAIQRGLHRLAKPWHRRRALWIFRDQTGLAVTPALWSSIQNALDGSDFFVLLASPEAARSPWVNREIEHWMATKSPDKILPVVTDGEWRWDPRTRDFSEDSTAVPAALRGAFEEEPLYLDLRWARDDRHLSLRHSRFRDAIAQLAAPMHGVSKDDLEGEDVRQHRRARRLRSGALATLVLLTFVAVLTGLMAVRNADRANAAAREAHRQQLSAIEQRTNAEHSATEARQQQSLATQQEARARDATAETQRQEELARRQRSLADAATAEATRQQQLARAQKDLAARAKSDAGRARTDATKQQQLADRAAARAKAQQRLAEQAQAMAQRWADEAAKQEKAAAAAGAEATAQQHNAEKQKRIAVARRLDNQATATIGTDPRTALMLGTAAGKIQSSDESKRALTGLVTGTRYAGTISPASTVTLGPGHIAAVGDRDGAVSMWNVADRGSPVKLSTVSADGGGSLALSPDGHLLAIVGHGGLTTLWNVTDPARPVKLGPLPGLTNTNALVFSPDSRMLASSAEMYGKPPDGPTFIDETILWNLTDPASPAQLAVLHHDDFPDGSALSPDGHTLVVSTSTEVEVWNVTDRSHPVRLTEMAQDFDEHVMAYSPAKPLLAISVAGSSAAVLWDMTDPAHPAQKGTVTSADWVSSLAFAPDGNVLTVGDGLGDATQFDVTAPAQPVKVGSVTDTSGAVGSLAYSADGQTLITSGGDDATLWNTTDYGVPSDVAEISAGSQASTFTPDGRSLVTVGADGTAALWDVSRTDHPAKTIEWKVSGTGAHAATFSADRRTLATGDAGGRITVTNLTDPKHPAAVATFAVPVIGTRPPEELQALAFSPDGHTLAAGTTMSRTTLWDLTDPAHARLLTTVTNVGVDTLAFSPDGHILAIADNRGGVQLEDVTHPDAPVRLAAISGHIRGTLGAVPVSFTPDGHTLIAGGGSAATTSLWDLTDLTHPNRLATLTGQTGTVTSAALSPDGRTLAVGSTDHTVLIWDVAVPSLPLRIATVKAGTLGAALALNPDGHTLVTGTGGTVTLWDYPKLNAIRADATSQACAMAGRGLTAAEWARYVPELPYQRTCQ